MIELPGARVYLADDGALTIQWIGPDRRAAIIFEEDSDESSWHFVSRIDGEPMMLHGEMSALNPGRFAEWLAKIPAKGGGR